MIVRVEVRGSSCVRVELGNSSKIPRCHIRRTSRFFLDSNRSDSTIYAPQNWQATTSCRRCFDARSRIMSTGRPEKWPGRAWGGQTNEPDPEWSGDWEAGLLRPIEEAKADRVHQRSRRPLPTTLEVPRSSVFVAVMNADAFAYVHLDRRFVKRERKTRIRLLVATEILSRVVFRLS